jgi:hypothetical protein
MVGGVDVRQVSHGGMAGRGLGAIDSGDILLGYFEPLLGDAAGGEGDGAVKLVHIIPPSAFFRPAIALMPPINGDPSGAGLLEFGVGFDLFNELFDEVDGLFPFLLGCYLDAFAMR